MKCQRNRRTLATSPFAPCIVFATFSFATLCNAVASFVFAAVREVCGTKSSGGASALQYGDAVQKFAFSKNFCGRFSPKSNAPARNSPETIPSFGAEYFDTATSVTSEPRRPERSAAASIRSRTRSTFSLISASTASREFTAVPFFTFRRFLVKIVKIRQVRRLCKTKHDRSPPLESRFNNVFQTATAQTNAPSNVPTRRRPPRRNAFQIDG